MMKKKDIEEKLNDSIEDWIWWLDEPFNQKSKTTLSDNEWTEKETEIRTLEDILYD